MTAPIVVHGPWPGHAAAFMPVSEVSEQWRQAASARLPQEELELIARKIRPEDRLRSMAARVLLALLLDRAEFFPGFGGAKVGGNGFEMLRFMCKTREGRPFFNMPGAPLFSLSHCDDYAACALLAPGLKNVCGLGIDIERTRPLRAEDYRAAFSPEELRKIGESSDSSSELIRRWTIKEATAKALGLGFLLDPSRLNTGCGHPLEPPHAGNIEMWKTESGTWSDIPPGKGAPETVRAVIEWRHLPGPEGYWATTAAAAQS